MNMIEKVAMAICPWGGKKDSKCPKCRVCYANAKAAIEAMREPSDEMLKAYYSFAYVDGILAYKAMIDAALKE